MKWLMLYWNMRFVEVILGMLEKSAILFSNWNMIKFHYQLSTNNLVVSIFKIVDDTVITGMTENLSIIGLSNPDKYFPRHFISLYRAPDKLRICVFYAMKTSKNACIIRSECAHYTYILLCKQTSQSQSVLVQSCT